MTESEHRGEVPIILCYVYYSFTNPRLREFNNQNKPLARSYATFITWVITLIKRTTTTTSS